MVSESDKIHGVYKIIKFNNFASKPHLGCLNGFIANGNNFVSIELWPVIMTTSIVGLLIKVHFGKP